MWVRKCCAGYFLAWNDQKGARWTFTEVWGTASGGCCASAAVVAIAGGPEPEAGVGGWSWFVVVDDGLSWEGYVVVIEFVPEGEFEFCVHVVASAGGPVKMRPLVLTRR